MAAVFFCYSHKDSDLRDRLETALAMLKREGAIDAWHDRRITAGADWSAEIDKHIQTADVVLLLISPDFLESDYCYGIEMTRALERRTLGQCHVIPVILRSCDWQHPPLIDLQAIPKDGLPVRKWPDIDDAFLDIVMSIRRVLGPASKPKGTSNTASTSPSIVAARVTQSSAARSSNLRLAKVFSEADVDSFRDEAFEFMAKYFEASLDELRVRNMGIETKFKRVSATQFTVRIYREGKALAECKIRLADGSFANGISYSASLSMGDNSYNECLSVEVDKQGMFLKALGLTTVGNVNFTFEGAAEYYWGKLVERLQ